MSRTARECLKIASASLRGCEMTEESPRGLSQNSLSSLSEAKDDRLSNAPC